MSAMTFEQAAALLREQNAEYQKKFDETLARMDRERKEANEKFERERKAADERFNRINQLTGSMQLDLGRLIELVLMPKLCAEVNKKGHTFRITSPNKRFYRDNGNLMLEMDLLLENCDEVMVIEIKSDCKKKDIEWHLGRLKLLRQHESITGMQGKKIYAAMATISIDDNIRDLALSHGMYVITIREEEDRVDVITPETKKCW